MMSDAEFTDTANSYENSVDPSKRKSHGIYYTDLPLAERMIEELDIPQKATVLDPCCGTGSFIFAAVSKGIEEAYGSDIDRNAIERCKEQIKGAAFIHSDSIEMDNSRYLSRLSHPEGVDFVIGNPPYAKWNPSEKTSVHFKNRVARAGNNLFVAGLIRALEFLKPGGVVSYVIPKNFLHVASYGSLRKEILKDLTILSITDIGSYFKDVRGEQIILTIKKAKPGTNRIAVKKLTEDHFVLLTRIDQSFFNDEIHLFGSETDFAIYNKLMEFRKLDDLCTGYIGRGRSKDDTAISGKEIRKFGFKNRDLPTDGNRIFLQNIYSSESGIIAAFGGNLPASQTVTVITDGDRQKCRFILGILHSKICNYFLHTFCYNYSRLTMHTDAKYIKKIPLPNYKEKEAAYVSSLVSSLQQERYMSDEWFHSLEKLDETLFAAYHITDAQRMHIENQMRIIQSKKWTK